jgi:hypothetical protein
MHYIYVRYVEGMIGRMYPMSRRLGYLQAMTTGIFCTPPGHFLLGEINRQNTSGLYTLTIREPFHLEIAI